MVKQWELLASVVTTSCCGELLMHEIEDASDFTLVLHSIVAVVFI